MDKLEIIFIDIDGTLLRTDRTVSHRVKKSLRRVREKGVELCLASGRSWEALVPMYSELGLEGPSICYNGAVIVENGSGKILFECGINEEVARFAIAECRRMNIELIAYKNSKLLYEFMDSDVAAYETRVNLEGHKVNFDEIQPLSLTKCVALGAPETLALLQQLMSSNFSSGQLSMTRSDLRFLEIMGPNINKGIAVRKLSELREFNLEAAAAFGDGLNDAEMLQSVAYPWVMDNADPELKKLFSPNRVIPGSDYDGLAVVLESFLAGRPPVLTN